MTMWFPLNYEMFRLIDLLDLDVTLYGHSLSITLLYIYLPKVIRHFKVYCPSHIGSYTLS